ncbi:hypothetical protein SRB5_19180 [Streptomyces sp. RB5]|uniref:Secreted protein n=1 Tax=Streptomyces smaragdinus TaxID=2585196 RepID=A0A7K0CE96_9ACTN|nr:hypothetical protein [Streptomyces smaragdinus]MQY11799.1 hypothetical protein [Streptomyces smaragdinus]
MHRTAPRRTPVVAAVLLALLTALGVTAGPSAPGRAAGSGQHQVRAPYADDGCDSLRPARPAAQSRQHGEQPAPRGHTAAVCPYDRIVLAHRSVRTTAPYEDLPRPQPYGRHHRGRAPPAPAGS